MTTGDRNVNAAALRGTITVEPIVDANGNPIAGDTTLTGVVVSDGTTERVRMGQLTPTTYGLEVTNESGTVIIDGTSNMFKIAATGTTSRTQAAGTQGSVSITLTALGNTNTVTPAYSSWLSTGSAISDGKLMSPLFAGLSQNAFVAVTSAGPVTWQVVRADYVGHDFTLITAGEVVYTLFLTNADSVSRTIYSRYYILHEAAL